MRAAVNALKGDPAEAIRGITNGGAHVGVPAGDGTLQINMRGIYPKQLAFFGTRGMPAWKYQCLPDMMKRGQVDLTPMVARDVSLSGASTELRAMHGPTAPGTAVITDFAA